MRNNNYRTGIIIATCITFLLFILFIYSIFWLKKEALDNSKRTADLFSKEITHTIELYFRDALTINQIYAGNFLLYKQNKIPRHVVYNLLKGSLVQNKNFLAIWTMWEPNAYDHNDIKYVNDLIHDVKGNFAIAYYYDNQQIKNEINDTLDYYEDFYTIPAKFKKPIILDPFHYIYHANPKSFYETSLVCPIINNNEFLGVIGIDIDLQMLQNKFKNIQVFNSGFISILSNSGQIVTHPTDSFVDNNLSKFLHPKNKDLLTHLKTGAKFSTNSISEFSGKKVIRQFFPINMEYMVAPWYIMVEIPEAEIFAYVNKLKFVSLLILLIILILSGYLIYNFVNRAKAEMALKESEIFNKTLFQDSRNPLIVMDSQNFKYIDCNEAAVKIYGCKNKEETLGKTPIDFSAEIQYNGVSQVEARKRIEEALEYGSVFFEWRHKRPNGEIWDAEVHLMAFNYKGKKLLQFSLTDITDKKRTLDALMNSEQQYRSLFENANDAIFVMEENKFIDCNYKTLKMFKCQRDEIIGKEPYIFSPEYQANNELSENKAIHYITEAFNGNPQFFEWIHKKMDGELFDAEVSLTLIANKNKKCLLAMVRDITERKKNEIELNKHRNNLEEIINTRTNEIVTLNEELTQSNEELMAVNEILYNQKEELTNTLEKLKETQEQLIQSEKMASIGILTAGVAHEINNPLNFIQAGIYSLESIFEDLKFNSLDSKNKDNLKKIIQNMTIGVDRVSEIVTSLGRFSRKGNDLKQACDIHNIIDNCLVILNNVLKHKCKVEKYFAEKTLQVNGNEGKLHQVFINILNNSAQSIENFGFISISTSLSEDYKYVQIKITDNGTGIDSENLNKIYDPFFTTKDPGQGTGLGLSIVYTIIQEHNGTIEYKSNKNIGTEVFISLPV